MGHSSPGSSAHEISQARILDSHSLPQGIFLTQGSNLPHCKADSLPSVPSGKQDDCEWLANIPHGRMWDEPRWGWQKRSEVYGGQMWM